MHVIDQTSVLDRQQLRDITMDDEDLMREILLALVDDTSKQIAPLDSAIRDRDQPRTMRLAHYAKGACANVGAHAIATVLKRLEKQAAEGSFADCAISFANFRHELDRLRAEAATWVNHALACPADR